MTRGAILLLLAAASSGCDAFVGLPDVPPAQDASDGSSVDARNDANRPQDARADRRDARLDATMPHDGSPPSAEATIDAGGDASCCTCRRGRRLEAGCLVTLAFEAGAPTSIVIDDAHLYWTSFGLPGSVGRAPLSPSDADPPVTLAANQDRAFRIALDAEHVYWVAFGTPSDAGLSTDRGTVMRVALDGGDAKALASGLTSPFGIAVRGGVVYFTEDVAGTGVQDVPVSGGPVSTAVPGAPTGSNLAIAASDVALYWTTYVSPTAGDLSVAAVPHGSPKTLVDALGEPWEVAVTAETIAWVTRDSVIEVATLPTDATDGGERRRGSSGTLMRPPPTALRWTTAPSTGRRLPATSSCARRSTGVRP